MTDIRPLKIFYTFQKSHIIQGCYHCFQFDGSLITDLWQVVLKLALQNLDHQAGLVVNLEQAVKMLYLVAVAGSVTRLLQDMITSCYELVPNLQYRLSGCV